MENNENFSSKPKTTPKDFFLNFGWLITLYVSVIALLNLVFDIINQIYPDAVSGGYYVSSGYSASIRWAIACLIIFFPIYIIITRYLRKNSETDPSRREIWVRKWFVYLTLFLSVLTIAIDLITLVNSFLGGELTTRFLLKVLATLVVTGAVFGYYFYDLRTEGGNNRTGKIFAWTSIILVAASIVWAFAVIGSPMNARLFQFDNQKVNDLQNIQYQVINYWQAKGKLPADLAALNDSISGYVAPVDSQTQQAYVYKVTGVKDFQLCADFNLSTVNNMNNNAVARPVGYASDNWTHGKGQKCFDRTIDSQLYPVKPAPVPVR